MEKMDCVWWLMPVILSFQYFGKSRQAEHLSSGVRPVWVTWRNPSYTKYTNITRALGYMAICDPSHLGAEVGGPLEPGRQKRQRL